MDFCGCGSSADLQCISCNTFLCQSHAISHIADGDEHHLVKIKPKISSEIKEKILVKISIRNQMIEQCRNESYMLTRSLISQIVKLSNDSLAILREYEEENRNILKILDNGLDPELTKQISSFLSNEMSIEYIIPAFLDKFKLWCEQKFDSLNLTCKNEEIKTTDKELFTQGHLHDIPCVAITNDRKYLMYPSLDYSIRVWDLEQKKIVSILQGHTDDINSLKVSNDNHYLVSASNDKTVRVWSLENSEQVAVIPQTFLIRIAIISKDNQYIVSDNFKILNIWKLRDMQGESFLTDHSSMIMSIAMTSDNQFIVSGSHDCTIRVSSSERKCEEALLQGHSGPVMCVEITEDNKYIVSASLDKTVRIWSLKDKILLNILEGHTSCVNFVAATNDNKFLVSCSTDKTIKVWNLQTLKEEFTLKGHGDTVNSVVATSDSKYIISCSRDSTIRFWNLQGNDKICYLKIYKD